MAASRQYEPRRAAYSILYQVVRDHHETFRVSTEDGAGLPRFIDEAAFAPALRRASP